MQIARACSRSVVRSRYRGPGARVEVGERALVDDPAPIDDRDARAQLLDLGEQMAGEENGHSFCGEALDQVAHVTDPAGVEPVGRLVQDQQPGLAQERDGEPEPLAHPLRVAADPVTGPLAQLDELEQLLDPAATVAAVEGREQLEILAPAQIGIEVRRLDEPGHAVERFGQLVLRVAPEQTGRPGVRAHEPEQDAHRRRLSGAVGAEKAVDVPVPDDRGRRRRRRGCGRSAWAARGPRADGCRHRLPLTHSHACGLKRA